MLFILIVITVLINAQCMNNGISLTLLTNNYHKIIRTTHIRPCILLQFNIHTMYIIEKVKLMKILYNKLFKCQMIMRNIIEFLYNREHSPCQQINKLVQNNILFIYKHSYLCHYCYYHYFLIKCVYLFIYTYRS